VLAGHGEGRGATDGRVEGADFESRRRRSTISPGCAGFTYVSGYYCVNTATAIGMFAAGDWHIWYRG